MKIRAVKEMCRKDKGRQMRKKVETAKVSGKDFLGRRYLIWNLKANEGHVKSREKERSYRGKSSRN